MIHLLSTIDKSRQGNVKTRHHFEQVRTRGQAGPAVSALEGIVRRQVRRKGIGLVLKSADGDQFLC